jgi:CxxC motif-containing protein (DUF1111 family)
MGADATIPTPRPVRRKIGAATIELAQRNPVALWGAGSIDKFRREGGDVIRRRVAEEQTERWPWITGRVPKTASGKEGWFGWRGQIATLDDFTLSACATELGLRVPGFQEDEIPVATSQPVGRLTGRRRDLDLTEEQSRALTSFVHSLPRPQDPTTDSQTALGQRIFDRIGCSGCHVPDLGWLRGVYTDLLLHDMGDDTRDAQTAIPEQMIVPRATDPVSYYTSFFLTIMEIDSSPEQEWRTPPLWGVADSAPYFHDGRAATLKEAIELHDGEARRAALAFRQLDDEDRQALLAFLGSLKSPADGP